VRRCLTNSIARWLVGRGNNDQIAETYRNTMDNLKKESQAFRGELQQARERGVDPFAELMKRAAEHRGHER
jgi:hypothetical protein